MTNKKGKREEKNQYLVGIRCKDWGKGCDCVNYIADGMPELLKEKFNCIYSDACFYEVIKAKDADSVNMIIILQQLNKQVTKYIDFTDFYLVAKVVPNN